MPNLGHEFGFKEVGKLILFKNINIVNLKD